MAQGFETSEPYFKWSHFFGVEAHNQNKMLKSCKLLKNCSETNVLRSSFCLSRFFCGPATTSSRKRNEDSTAPIQYEPNQKIVANRLTKFLKCPEEEAMSLIRKNKELGQIPTLELSKTVAFLCKKNVKTRAMIENPWLLGVPLSELLLSITNITTT